MRKGKFNVLIFAITLLIYSHVNAQEVVDEHKLVKQEETVEQIIKSLEKNNPLRVALERGERGDGVYFDWMSEMKKFGIKHVSYIFEFVRGREPKEISITQINYYSGYYEYGKKISDVPILSRMTSSGLEKKLKAVAETITQERIYDLSKETKFTCGKFYVQLLDDETLPIVNIMPDLDFECGCSK